ncbi:MAG: ABC transporter substrate-binding protein [Bacillota bacterium]|jgi:ABC-type transport system substrate-binding protein
MIGKRGVFAVLGLFVFMGIFLITVGFAAEQTKYGGTLKIATLGLDTSDPHRHTGSIAVQQVYAEALTSIGDDGSVKPFLAEKYVVSKDGLTYTFKLRKKVKFHNGREMTAADVVANFQRVKKLASGWLASAMKLVSQVTAKDKYTVKVRMSAPYAPFLNLISELWIVAPESPGWNGQIEHPICTGPFMFGKWIPNVSFSGPKHKEYWQKGLPYAAAIYFDLGDNSNGYLKLRSGDLDIVAIGSDQDKAKKLISEGFKVEPMKDSDWVFWAFNNRKPRAPFDKLEVRKAISYVIDKATLMQVAAGGKGIITNQMVAPGNFYYDNALAKKDLHKQADLAKAKKILKKLGVKPAKITVKFVSWQQPYASVCAEMVKKLGFKVNHLALDDLGAQNELGKYDWDMCCMSSGPRADIYLRYVRLTSDGPNPVLWGGIRDPRLDKLINQAVITADNQQRRSAYLRAYQRVINKYYFIVAGHRFGQIASNKRIQGFHPGFTWSQHRVDGGVAFAWIKK